MLPKHRCIHRLDKGGKTSTYSLFLRFAGGGGCALAFRHHFIVFLGFLRA